MQRILSTGILLITSLLYHALSSAETLSQRFPEDKDIADADTVLLHEDFEQGWRNWDYPSENTRYLFIDTQDDRSHSGDAYLRSTVSAADLKRRRYITAAARYSLDTAVDEIFLRMYVKFEGVAPKPHHWIRLAATDGDFDIRGKAGSRPDGDEAFWITLDVNHLNLPFYYVYWHGMRSGRCNDGSAQEGCAGDQGETYYYGNSLKSVKKDAFPLDEWLCIEMHFRANTPDEHDGIASLYMNDELQMEYVTGKPVGTWLRAVFHPGGCRFKACDDLAAFEGLDLRTDSDVKFRELFIGAYDERGSFNRRLNRLRELHDVASDVQTIYYDDVVVATERIGCMQSADLSHIKH